MSNPSRSVSKQKAGPADPSEMLIYKRHFDRGQRRKTRTRGRGEPSSVVESVRYFVANWLTKARILSHRLARRISIIFFRGASRVNIVKKVLAVRRSTKLPASE